MHMCLACHCARMFITASLLPHCLLFCQSTCAMLHCIADYGCSPHLSSIGAAAVNLKPTPSPSPIPSLGVTEVQAAAGPAAAPANTTAITYEHTFQATYATLAADAAAMTRFKLDVRRSIANATGVALDNVRVTSVKAGSVIVTTEVAVPDTWTPAQVQQLNQVLTEKVAEVFTPAFLTTHGIQGVPTVKVLTPIPKESDSNAVGLGVGIGVGLGGTLVITGAILMVVRRRRMRVDPATPSVLPATQPQPETA